MRSSTLYVYTAAIPTDVGVVAVFPSSRSEEILSCGSEKAKKEKYCAWKLLEYALQDAFHKDLRALSFTKSAQGKWTCDFCYFSLSHSHGGVTIALSDKPVGIDLEKIIPVKNREKVAKKILTDTEWEDYQRLSHSDKEANAFLLELWTKKESIFKRGSIENFVPCRISADNGTKTQKVRIAGEEYFLSVSGKEGVQVVLRENVNYLP